MIHNRLRGNHMYLLRYWSTLCQHSPLRRGSECWQEILPLQRASSSQRIVHGCPRKLKDKINFMAILVYAPGSYNKICRAGEMRQKSQVLCWRCQSSLVADLALWFRLPNSQINWENGGHKNSRGCCHAFNNTAWDSNKKLMFPTFLLTVSWAKNPLYM